MILTEDSDRRNVYEEFCTEMVQVVNPMYGKGLDDLSAWQNICKIVRVLAVPDDSETCRKGDDTRACMICRLKEVSNLQDKVCELNEEASICIRSSHGWMSGS